MYLKPTGFHKYIYVLLCPDTGKVHYVGRTRIPGYRMGNHQSGYSTAPVDVWKRSLRSVGKRAVFRVIEKLGPSQDTWQFEELHKEREKWWMRYFRRHNQPLLNTKPGKPKGWKNT